jgi:hypothetical protein
LSEALPEKESAATRIIEAVAKDVLALGIPGGNLMFQLLYEYKQRKLNEAQARFIEEVRKGDRKLDEAESLELVPIAYRYFKAAEEGTTAKNLELLAKLIRHQIQAHELSVERYSTLHLAIRDLSARELIVLSMMCRASRTAELDNVDSFGNEQFDKLREDLQSQFPDHFPERSDITGTFALLAGKGWVVPLIEAVLGGSVPTYVPTNLTFQVADIIQEMDLDCDA